MIASGELFLLNGLTGGKLQPLPQFLNKNVSVIAGNSDRVYVACEPPLCPDGADKRPCTVWCFEGDADEPVQCPEFEAIEDTIQHIAIGEKHLLVLTSKGTVYSRGNAVYGSTGHGGARDVPHFAPVPALKNRNVRLVAAGPHFSIAITHEGDVFSWGQAFNGETGIFGKVEAVPRFAPEVTKLHIVEVSCGHGHVLARTEGMQCVSWGENTCGQRGLGEKSKPTYKPQVLECIPSQIQNVSAGWAHSVAVGNDGHVYSWGLNSHGQLGLGDTMTRLAPERVEFLLKTHQVESAHAAKTLTCFRAADSQVLFCGQVPCAPHITTMADFHPRHPGETDPPGCLLVPMPLQLVDLAGGNKHSLLSMIVAFDRGIVGLARSTVYKVSPNLAPVQGGTQISASVTGLPFEPEGSNRVQDSIPLKVRLSSASPPCECIVPGKIVGVDLINFTAPSVADQPLGAVVERGFTSPVQLRISIDDGFTWTPDRQAPPTMEELNENGQSLSTTRGGPGTLQSLRDVNEDFAVQRKLRKAKSKASTVLWYCLWPEEGPQEVEPCCAPVTGGTELLLHVELPQQMPTEHLTVKFVCNPLHSMGDPELEKSASMRRDAAEMVNLNPEDRAMMPLVGYLEVPVHAWLDPGGRGVRCTSPPLDEESVRFYRYSLLLSLDGCVFLPRSLPFAIYDLRVLGLEPSLGPLMEQSQVRIKAKGLVETNVLRVRVDFPKDLGLEPMVLPASMDYTTGEISFTMPDLAVQVRRCIDEVRALAAAQAPSEDAGDQDGSASASPDGGLHGLEVFVELSLNNQNFTKDCTCFTYHGPLEAEPVVLLSAPESVANEQSKDDKKDAKKSAGKVAAEETAFILVKPGAKLGCSVRPIMQSAYMQIRMELSLKMGEEEPQPFKVVTLPAKLEVTKLPQVQASGGKGGQVEQPEPEAVELLVAAAPEVPLETLPKGAVLLISSFGVSMNGQSVTPCQAQPQPMRLEPATSPMPEASGS